MIKLKKFISETLTEVGEGNIETHEYEVVSEKKVNFGRHMKAEFSTENELRYVVSIAPTYLDVEKRKQRNTNFSDTKNVLRVEFQVKGKSLGKIVNAKNPLKVINTVAEIASSELKQNKKANGIIFKGSGSPQKAIQREKIYKTFIKKRLPSVEFIKLKNEKIAAILNED